jgi:hypothetical protein
LYGFHFFQNYINNAVITSNEKRREDIAKQEAASLILLDSHQSRRNSNIWRRSAHLKFMTVMFPANTTRKLHICDATVVGQLRRKMRTLLELQTTKRIKKQGSGFAAILKSAFYNVFHQNIITNVFVAMTFPSANPFLKSPLLLNYSAFQTFLETNLQILSF